MSANLFLKDGHIARWVFYPPAWGGDGYWCDGFSETEKTDLFNHMKSCHTCRAAEIEATLHWAELQPRATQTYSTERQIHNEPAQSTSKVNRLFDTYPKYLLEAILQYCKGKVITINRGDDGEVKQIIGELNGELDSNCIFIYDGATTSVHCYCHNCQDDPLTTRKTLTFADFHIDFSRDCLIEFSLDVTDFYPDDKDIRRFHTNHKLFTDSHGRIIKILQDNKPWYRAEYDENQNLTKEVYGIITTEYGYIDNKKNRTEYVFISLNPKDDSYMITVSGVESVVRRIKQELKLKGCLWDLSALNPQGCRRTAVSKDYEMAENSPVHHPEMTLCGQYGHSLTVAQKHYWRKSLKNAYRLVKGNEIDRNMQQHAKPSETPLPKQDLKDIFPESSFFSGFLGGVIKTVFPT